MSALQVELPEVPRGLVRTVLGLDPGTSVLGYGLVAQDAQGKLHALLAGAILLDKYANHYVRLGVIYSRVRSLAEAYSPTEVAVEAPFFGKNAQSMLKLGRAQGVAIAATMGGDRPVTEYAPRRVKLAITGQGGASKEQVAYFLSQMFPRLDLRELHYHDATDGLAVAVCHALQASGGPSQRGGGWADFVRRHPGRLRGAAEGER